MYFGARILCEPYVISQTYFLFCDTRKGIGCLLSRNKAAVVTTWRIFQTISCL